MRGAITLIFCLVLVTGCATPYTGISKKDGNTYIITTATGDYLTCKADKKGNLDCI